MQRTSKYLVVTTWGEGGKVISTWREGSETWNGLAGLGNCLSCTAGVQSTETEFRPEVLNLRAREHHAGAFGLSLQAVLRHRKFLSRGETEADQTWGQSVFQCHENIYHPGGCEDYICYCV